VWCLTTGAQSDFYQGGQPQIVACAPIQPERQAEAELEMTSESSGDLVAPWEAAASPCQRPT
jgi:hypothetical protein